MNGAQLAAKARHVRPGLKVLLTSGYVADQADDYGIGMDVPVSTSHTGEMSLLALCVSS